MMAAVSAAESGAKVTVLEKMNRCGKKLLITGKGRCNITNIADTQTFIKNMPGNGRFLYTALNTFYNQQIIDFLAKWGVKTKVERGGRVFPVSDQATDVVAAFTRALAAADVKVLTGQAVKRLLTEKGRVCGVETASDSYACAAVIVAAGGASYPGTGSAGEGYLLAEAAGHNIIPLKPSLVPIEVAEEYITELQGLALKNVTAAVIYNGKKVQEEFGEMLFTHFGLSGPIILSLSNPVGALLHKDKNAEISIAVNLKPALTQEVLDRRLQKDFSLYTRKMFKNSLGDLLPGKMANVIIDLSYIDPEKPVNQITKAERRRLSELLQNLVFTITALRPLSEAIVTSGGVDTKEINPGTMESKLVKALYFAGEVIDIDGFTGGYNLQAVFSTGYMAGKNAAVEHFG